MCNLSKQRISFVMVTENTYWRRCNITSSGWNTGVSLFNTRLLIFQITRTLKTRQKQCHVLVFKREKEQGEKKGSYMLNKALRKKAIKIWKWRILKIKLHPTCSYLEKVCRVLNPLGKSREVSLEIISL